MCIYNKIDYDYAHYDRLDAPQPDKLRRRVRNRDGMNMVSRPAHSMFFYYFFFPTQLINSLPLDYLYA